MSDPTAAFAAAAARHQAGDLAAAERLYRALLADHPTHAQARSNFGALLVRAGRLDEAAEQYRLALAADPGYADAHFNFGNLHRRTGQLGPAAEHYRACLARNPAHPGARHNLGIVHATLGELAAAEECFRAVVRLEPANADALARLGDVLVRAGKADEGVAALRTAVGLTPDDPRTLQNYGLALAAAGRHQEAHDVLQHALRLNPTYAEAHNALGLALEGLGRKDDVLARYRQAVALKPDHADAWSNLGTNLGEQGRADDAIDALRESLRVRPDAPAIHSNLLLMTNYTSRLTPEQVRDEALAWAARFAGEPPPAPPVPEPRDPDRRLRMGYLSADFRKHTVAPFIETLLRHHDRARVEVFAYAHVPRPDETTERLNALADHWRPIAGVPDEQVVRQIGDDRIDVLIDLSGHTAGNRLPVLARRPAPVQALLFGYPNTTGMRAVDYRITDATSDPPGTEHLYAERLLRLPEVPWVYAPPTDAPQVNELPSLGGGPFTLGCLNNAAKISDACLAAWAAVLLAVPEARLVLLAGQSRAGAEHLVERFAAAGVARERIEPVSRLARTDYFAAYRRFDLTLDPFPYNGGVTTGDSLWMGVPVLNVAGANYVARQGAMALTAVGLGECVAESPEGLAALVRRWANDRPRLAELRAGLRERVARSPLADGPRYVRHLEDALRRVWRERLPPLAA